MAINDDSPNAVVDRVISILGALSGAEPLTSSRISRRTGLPRSSVHRLLQRLVELGVVTRDGYAYQIGFKLYELGSLAATQNRVHRVAMPHMARLSRQTGMSVYLATLSGPDVVYIEDVWTDWAGPLRRGVAHPAHLTASGKMLLACLPPENRPAIDFVSIRPKTRHSIITESRLDRELAAIREIGLASSDEEFLLGSTSIAVQIGPPEHATTALSLWGPTELVRRQPGIDTRLRQAGRAMWTATQRGPAAPPPVHNSAAPSKLSTAGTSPVSRTDSGRDTRRHQTLETP